MTRQASKISVFSAVFAMLAMLLGMASPVMGNQITLRHAVALPAGPVTLGDVANLQGELAHQFGQTVVGTLDKTSLTVSMQDIRAKLDAANANWGRLSLRGFMSCQVSLKAAEASPETLADSQSPAVAVANPSQVVASDSVMTLRGRVVQELIRHTGQGADDLRVTFSPRDSQTLAQSVLAGRWEVEINSAGKLGRVLVTIRQWQDGRVTQTHRMNADVSARMLAVVALRDIRRGEAFASGDVEIQEVYVSESHRLPATDLQAIVGRVSRESVSKGQMIYASEAVRPELVKRGDRLVVRCVVGGLVVKISARALEGGAMEDVITVANLDSNERFKARVVASREAVLIDAASAGKEQGHE